MSPNNQTPSPLPVAPLPAAPAASTVSPVGQMMQSEPVKTGGMPMKLIIMIIAVVLILLVAVVAFMIFNKQPVVDQTTQLPTEQPVTTKTQQTTVVATPASLTPAQLQNDAAALDVAPIDTDFKQVDQNIDTL